MELLDCSFGFRLGARSEVDALGIVFGELQDRLLSQPDVTWGRVSTVRTVRSVRGGWFIPPVINITLPSRAGMSVSALNETTFLGMTP